MFRRILIAIDSNGPGNQTVQAAADLAAQSGAAVRLVHVVSPPVPFGVAPFSEALELEDTLFDSSWKMLKQFHDQFPPGLKVESKVLEGRPAQEIVANARDWQADLVMVGDHNHHMLSRILLGSTADAVVRNATCPVLVVRPQIKSTHAAHRNAVSSGEVPVQSGNLAAQ